ncbi:MAG: 3-keto-5-aminohexanoate cleavage protein [Desulfobulbaceae bacterium BRH_c16a]|nr:MAG: 3-keto-5-aminohexanoate cleavage protein [Desulfobulbaceae bacterium BRH_c16a]
MTTEPLIITCAVVGAELTREVYPDLPKSPDEIAVAAEQAVAAGASVIHLHVRDEAGRPSQRVDIFAEVSDKIRRRCDCILQYSTGGAVGTPLSERCAPLQLRPEMATLSMGTMNFGPEIYENSEETITAIAAAIQANGCMAELEIFDLGMLESIDRLAVKKILPEEYHIDFVLGVPGGMAGTFRNLALLVDRLTVGRTWSVAALGRQQLPLTTHGIAMGGHVRVGLEDNIYYRKGELAQSNAQLVARLVRLSVELERPVATVAEARKILGLDDRLSF